MGYTLIAASFCSCRFSSQPCLMTPEGPTWPSVAEGTNGAIWAMTRDISWCLLLQYAVSHSYPISIRYIPMNFVVYPKKHISMFWGCGAWWSLLWNFGCVLLFPTCQVRVVRFYQSCSPPPPASSSISSSSSSSQSRSQWAQPDLHRELQIPVGTAGPPPRAPDPSGHCRTSTASSRSQWALPDLNRDFQVAVGTAGPQPRFPDRSGHCRTSTAR